MNLILNLLWEWRFAIVVAIAFLLLCLLEWQKGKAVLYAIMLQAKRLAKDAILQSGKEQEEWVIKKAMQYMPVSLKLFLCEPLVRKIVKWLFNKGKDYLDNGKIDNSL